MARPPRTDDDELLLGEWACLGILYSAPTHGFAIAARLKPDGDVGRVWSLSRPLTYRSLHVLAEREYIEAVGEEPGIAGGPRTVLAATRRGRANLRKWLSTPVAHQRDLRSELLLKLVIADICNIDVHAMLVAQRDRVARSTALNEPRDLTAAAVDPVALWRLELSRAALRFLDQLAGGRADTPDSSRMPS
jgi:DNA-binding PadR family transcriptional regulator